MPETPEHPELIDRAEVLLRKAINDKCRWCIVDERATGSAAVQIELCASVECPLWLVRPVRAPVRDSETGIVQRVPYSAAVVSEYGLSEREAATRLAEPRNPAVFLPVAPLRRCTGADAANPEEAA